MFSAFQFLAGINISTPRSVRRDSWSITTDRLMENLGFMHVEQGESSDE